MNHELNLTALVPTILLAVLWIAPSQPVFSQAPSADRVTVRQSVSDSANDSIWKPLKTSTYIGRVVDFNAKELVVEMRKGDGEANPNQMRIPSNQIQAIDPVWQGDSTAQVVELFQQRNYREFIQSLSEVDKSKIPNWQQLLLLSMVIRAVDAVQGPSAAAPPFLKLAETAPTMLYADMPLCWTATETSADLIKQSLTWIESTNEAAQLLGASWLAQGVHSAQAKETLVRLKQSKNLAVAQLASAQSWRYVSPTETMGELSNWLAFRDKMLLPLALGPTEFIADRLARIGQVDLAIGEWAWIAAHHQERFHRAQRALKSAEELLKKQGQTAQAESIAVWIHEMQPAQD